VAALVGAAAYGVDHGIGGNAGDVVVLLALLGVVTAIVARSRKAPVNPGNVNAEWDGGVQPTAVPAAPAAV